MIQCGQCQGAYVMKHHGTTCLMVIKQIIVYYLYFRLKSIDIEEYPGDRQEFADTG